jgi:hypothetical protein
MNHKKVITELSVVEQNLDTVLFDMGDAAFGGALGLGGVGTAGYLYGRRGRKKPQELTVKAIGETIGRGLGTGVTDAGASIRKNAKSIWASILKRMPK